MVRTWPSEPPPRRPTEARVTLQTPDSMSGHRRLTRSLFLPIEQSVSEPAAWLLAVAAFGLLRLHRGLLPHFPGPDAQESGLGDAWVLPILLGASAWVLTRDHQEAVLARPLPRPARYLRRILRLGSFLCLPVVGLALGGLGSQHAVDLPRAAQWVCVATAATWALPDEWLDALGRWLLGAALVLAAPALVRRGVPLEAQALAYLGVGLLARNLARA